MRYYLAPLAAAAFAFSAIHAAPISFSMGNHGADVIKSACSKAGGDYSHSGSGAYGCEYPNGGEVLCDKNGNCTGYTASRVVGHGAGRMGLDNAMKAIATSPQGGGAPGPHGNMTGTAPLGASEAAMNTRATTTSPLNNNSGGTVMTRGTLIKQPH